MESDKNDNTIFALIMVVTRGHSSKCGPPPSTLPSIGFFYLNWHVSWFCLHWAVFTLPSTVCSVGSICLLYTALFFHLHCPVLTLLSPVHTVGLFYLHCVVLILPSTVLTIVSALCSFDHCIYIVQCWLF